MRLLLTKLIIERGNYGMNEGTMTASQTKRTRKKMKADKRFKAVLQAAKDKKQTEKKRK